MKVKLSHAKNPDIEGGYWSAPQDKCKAMLIEVDSLEHASRVCRYYIERNGLGGGNWAGGDITVDGRKIARVAYNGNVFDLADQKIELVKTEAA